MAKRVTKNKRKIINDPVHGFVTLPTDFIFDLMEHPYFQRLRRIKQLGLTHYVYPGATHTRFQHTIGALHLMTQAIACLRSKGVAITNEEMEGVYVAILLHDVGHGPFSHALEESIISGIHHEQISQILMSRLNETFSGKLDVAIAIFNNSYPKKFLHQLVTSQLDMDRLDYIQRDSFYTGVTEGTIGTDRILKMLTVKHDQLVVEKKAMYSVEKFLIARRLMYWQVYLHKTVIASENLLVRMLKRAKYLAERKEELFATPALRYFLYENICADNLNTKLNETLGHFIELDDNDILASAKDWQRHSDPVLRELAISLVNRKLPVVKILDERPDAEWLNRLSSQVAEAFRVEPHEVPFLVSVGELSNSAYSSRTDMIQILSGKDEVQNLSEVSDILSVAYLHRGEKKYYICYPRHCGV